MSDCVSFCGIDVSAIDAQCLNPLICRYGDISILHFIFIYYLKYTYKEMVSSSTVWLLSMVSIGKAGYIFYYLPVLKMMNWFPIILQRRLIN